MGRSPVETGLLLTPWPVATAIMAPIAGPLSDRYPPPQIAFPTWPRLANWVVGRFQSADPVAKA